MQLLWKAHEAMSAALELLDAAETIAGNKVTAADDAGGQVNNTGHNECMGRPSILYERMAC